MQDVVIDHEMQMKTCGFGFMVQTHSNVTGMDMDVMII